MRYRNHPVKWCWICHVDEYEYQFLKLDDFSPKRPRDGLYICYVISDCNQRFIRNYNKHFVQKYGKPS